MLFPAHYFAVSSPKRANRWFRQGLVVLGIVELSGGKTTTAMKLLNYLTVLLH